MSKSAVTALFLSLVVGQGFYPDLLLAKTPPTFEDFFSDEIIFSTKWISPIVASELGEVVFCPLISKEEFFLLGSAPYLYQPFEISPLEVSLPHPFLYSLAFSEKVPFISILSPKEENPPPHSVKNTFFYPLSEMGPFFSFIMEPQKVALSEVEYFSCNKQSFYEEPALQIEMPRIEAYPPFFIATLYTPTSEPSLGYFVITSLPPPTGSILSYSMRLPIASCPLELNELGLNPNILPILATLKDYDLEPSLFALEIESSSFLDSFELMADASQLNSISTETFNAASSPRFRPSSKKGNKTSQIAVYKATLPRALRSPYYQAKQTLSPLKTKPKNELSSLPQITPLETISCEISPSFSLDFSYVVSLTPIKELNSSSTFMNKASLICTTRDYLPISNLNPVKYGIPSRVKQSPSFSEPIKNSSSLSITCDAQLHPSLNISLASFADFSPEHQIDYVAFSLDSAKLDFFLPEALELPNHSAIVLKKPVIGNAYSFQIKGKKEEPLAFYDTPPYPIGLVPSEDASFISFPLEKDSGYFYTPASLYKTSSPFIAFNIAAPDCEFVYFIKEIEKAQISPSLRSNENSNEFLFQTKNPLVLTSMSPSRVDNNYDTLVEQNYKLFQKTIFMVGTNSLKSSTTTSSNLNQKYRVVSSELSKTPSLEELSTYNFSEEFLGKVQIAAKPDGSGYYFSLDIRPISSERLTPIKQNIYFIIDKNRTTDRYLIDSYKTAIKQTLPYIYSDDAYNVYVYDGVLQKMESEPVYRKESSIEKINKFITKQGSSFRYSNKTINALLDEINTVTSNYPSDVNTVILFTNGAGLYSANKENQENIYAKLPVYAKNFSIYPAVVKKSANVRGLEKLSEVYRGKCIVSSTYNGLPRNVGKQVKVLQRPVIKDLHVTPLTKGRQSVKIFPDTHHFPEIFSQSPTIIYGFTNSIQAFELFLQGSIQDEWMNARIPIYIDSAENGGSHLRKKCMALESKAKHLSQL